MSIKPAKNEFELLKKKRFLPLFITQFLGAFNDNLYKNALIILLAFETTTFSLSANTLINLAAGLFILPYFLFSAFAGQLADKYEKSKLISYIKLVEVILAALACLGFYLHDLYLLLAALFLLGIQATFFGPLKYSILPQHLESSELLGGNGLIEMATFVAILLGTLLGGLLIAIPQLGAFWVSVTMLAIAILGFLSSLFIPKAPSFSKNIIIDWNFLKQTCALLKNTLKDKEIFYIIIGISWFWLYGSIILAQIANYTKMTLSGNEHVATLLLVVFSIGIGLGSIISEWLSSKKIEIGFVFLGCTGLTLFSMDLAMTTGVFTSHIFGVHEFLKQPNNLRILMDALLMGSFGGLYMVPLYTLLQVKSDPINRSSMIAANNIINAIFMVVAAILVIAFLSLGFTIPELFMLIAVLNAVMGLFLYGKIGGLK
jgi:MFS family permease